MALIPDRESLPFSGAELVEDPAAAVEAAARAVLAQLERSQTACSSRSWISTRLHDDARRLTWS